MKSSILLWYSTFSSTSFLIRWSIAIDLPPNSKSISSKAFGSSEYPVEKMATFWKLSLYSVMYVRMGVDAAPFQVGERAPSIFSQFRFLDFLP
jgi:hypothetical protein